MYLDACLDNPHKYERNDERLEGAITRQMCHSYSSLTLALIAPTCFLCLH